LRIFISHARKDGGALAHRLQSDLTKEGFDAWLDTQRLRSGSVWSVEIEHEIDKRQVTLALLSPWSYTSEICHAEQLRALDSGANVSFRYWPLRGEAALFFPRGRGAL